MSELPDGWVQAALQDISNIRMGKTVLKKDLSETGLPVFSAGAENKPWGVVDNMAATARRGTIVISARGSIGFPKLPDFDEFISTQTTIAVEPPEDIASDYLLHAVSHIDFQELSSGAAIPMLTVGTLGPVQIPLPPLAEQKRIVRKLDTLSARTTAARTHLTAIAKLVERQKLAVLGHLFGKPGSDPKPTEHLWAIPASWDWKKVKEIGEVGLGRQRSPENHNGPDMRPYIRSANITWSGVDTTDVKEMNFDESDFERFELKVGDVLLNEGSGSAKEVGKPAIWRGEIPNCCFQNTVLRVQPRDCSSEYLYWYFLLTALSEGFVKDTKGVNIQHIGKGGLANFPIPVPPSDEQDEIVRRIETALTEIDRIAAEAEKALKLTDRLDERILAKAFAGELVPQDPNDEPASVLLDRIREARANTPKKRRPTRKPNKMNKKRSLAKLWDTWPATGMTFEELKSQTSENYDQLKDKLFQMMDGAEPKIRQEFDPSEKVMRLMKVDG